MRIVTEHKEKEEGTTLSRIFRLAAYVLRGERVRWQNRAGKSQKICGQVNYSTNPGVVRTNDFGLPAGPWVNSGRK